LDSLQDFLELSGGGMDVVEEYLEVMDQTSRNAFVRQKNEIVMDHLNDIDKCFARDSVEEIFEALERMDTEWSKTILNTLRKKSPLSLKLTFRMFRSGMSTNLGRALHQDYVIAQNLMRGNEFGIGLSHHLLSSPLTRVPEDYIVNGQIRSYPQTKLLAINKPGQDGAYYEIEFPMRDSKSREGPPWSTSLDLTDYQLNQYFLAQKGFQPLHLSSFNDPKTPPPWIEGFSIDSEQYKNVYGWKKREREKNPLKISLNFFYYSCYHISSRMNSRFSFLLKKGLMNSWGFFNILSIMLFCGLSVLYGLERTI